MIEGDASTESLLSAIKSAGFDAAQLMGVENEEEKEAAEMVHYRKLLKKALFAAIVGVPLFILGMFGVLPGFEQGSGRVFWFVIGLITLSVLVHSGGHFFSGAFKSAKNHNANMDTLIALGTGSA